MKLDYDSQMFNMQRTYSQDQAKAEELRLRQLDSQLQKLTREREEMASRYRQDANSSLEQYKALSDSLGKQEERLRGIADKA